MNLDLETIQSWLQALPEDQESLAAFGRGFLCVATALFASLFTWLLSKLGWGGLKLAGRGARACWSTRPEVLLGYQLGQAVLASLKQTLQPPSPGGRAAIKFADGTIWLATGDISFRGEPIRELLPRRLHKRIWREARSIAACLDQEAQSSKKKKFLEVLQPSLAQNLLCAKAPSRREEAQADSTGPYPGEAERMTRLRAMLEHAMSTAGIDLKAPLPK